MEAWRIKELFSTKGGVRVEAVMLSSGHRYDVWPGRQDDVWIDDDGMLFVPLQYQDVLIMAREVAALEYTKR